MVTVVLTCRMDSRPELRWTCCSMRSLSIGAVAVRLRAPAAPPENQQGSETQGMTTVMSSTRHTQQWFSNRMSTLPASSSLSARVPLVSPNCVWCSAFQLSPSAAAAGPA